MHSRHFFVFWRALVNGALFLFSKSLRSDLAERLMLAKRLLNDQYRNILIDISIAAPTIIIPTTSDQNLLVSQPVLLVHLGFLKVSLFFKLV